MEEDPLLYLESLKEMNNHLQRKLKRLNELDKKLTIQNEKVNDIFETMLETEESQCVDMVEFDKEIKSLNTFLFKQSKKSYNVSQRRQENAKIIMYHIMHMQGLSPSECDGYLLETDPLLNGLKNDTKALHDLISKFSSFLI